MEWDIKRVETCESTQDEARTLLEAGAPSGTVVVAERMEGGRGQHGRAWHAPEGGLYLSFILRDPPEPRYITLALGNALADVLEVAGADPQLKWVNDVWCGGKKIAGILVEAETTGNDMVAVCGIGINVNGSAADWPHPLNGTATTLEDQLGADQCIPDLETYLLESIEGWLTRLGVGDTKGVIEAWRARDVLEGEKVGVDPDGDFCAKIFGRAKGIDDEGRLLVDVDGEMQAFAAGSVVAQT